MRGRAQKQANIHVHFEMNSEPGMRVSGLGVEAGAPGEHPTLHTEDINFT